MKYLLTLITLLFTTLVFAQPEQRQSDLQKSGISGKVLSIETVAYNKVYDGQKWVKQIQDDYCNITYYNRQGYRKLLQRKTPDGAGRYKTLYKYYKNRRLSNVKSYLKNNTLMEQYEYDTMGNELAYKHYKDGKTIDYITTKKYEYDSLGNIIHYQYYSGDYMNENTFYQYLQRKKTSEVSYYNTGVVYYAKKYDTSGNMIEYCYRCANDDKYILTNKYNAEGQKTEERLISSKDSSMNYTQDFLQYGKKSTDDVRADNPTRVVIFNKHGKLKTEKDLLAKTITYYWYDQHQNWIKISECAINRKHTTTRKIKYY